VTLVRSMACVLAIAVAYPTLTLGETPSSGSSAQQQTIVIQPTDPQVVYVPSYNPTTAYGSWPYPAYPPPYYPPAPAYYPGAALATGLAFGVRVASIAAISGCCHSNWGGGDVNINTTATTPSTPPTSAPAARPPRTQAPGVTTRRIAAASPTAMPARARPTKAAPAQHATVGRRRHSGPRAHPAAAAGRVPGHRKRVAGARASRSRPLQHAIRPVAGRRVQWCGRRSTSERGACRRRPRRRAPLMPNTV
jgi:hypothetical protein